MLRSTFPALLLVFVLATSTRAQERDWDSARTLVFVAGVLEWESSADWSSFESKDRRDAALVEFFRAAGVPEERIMYLQDSEATLEAIQGSLGELLARSQEGDLLFLYYCGHGYKDDSGVTYFANYDAGEEVSSAWSSASIVEAIEESFRGSRAVLAMDCCTSGGMAEQAEALGERVSYAVLTSSSANELSTGDWTFSQALLDALAGDALLDLDGSGSVTLDEAGRYAMEEMGTYHEQMATYAVTGSFDPEFVLSRASDGRPASPVGDRVEVEWEGEWYKAKVAEASGDELRVRWVGIGYDTQESDEWVAREKVRPIRATQYEVGTEVEVEWKGEWYPAVVLSVRGGVHRIHYEGYSDVWDEWVPSGRIRRR